MTQLERSATSGALLAHSQATAAPASRAARARIVLVEDHPIYAAGLQALFSADVTLEIVGHARDGATALTLVRHYQPEVIMLDIGLGTENGLDLINQFRRICPDVRILVITAHEETEYLMSALRLGAHAVIQKDMPGDSIIAATRQILKGERVVTQPAAMTAVITEFSQLLRQRERERSQLTQQELEILRLAAAGYKNKDIGADQFLSEASIKRKLHDVYRKLNVSAKPAAVAEALRLGLI